MSTTVTPIDRKGITGLLRSDEARLRIEPMLRGVEYDRVVGEAYLAAGENPDILSCTPASIIRAVARAVSWGLAIGETVHLVPFNQNVGTKQEPRWEKRLKAIQDYKGKIELVVGCGAAKAIDAQVVYEKEPFDYAQGSQPSVRHIPARSEKERGAMLGAYAIAHHGYSRPPHVVYLTVAEVDTIRQKYSKQWKDGPVPPWYMRKTAVHQLAKMLPKNPRLAGVLKVLDEDETEIDEELSGAPVTTVPAPPAQAVIGAGEEHALDDRWIEEQDSAANAD